MNQLHETRRRIHALSHKIHSLDEDKAFHPWDKKDAAEYSALTAELVRLRQKEFMLAHHAQPVSENMPLFRQHGHVEQQPSFMVGMLVFVAFICVMVFFLLATAGVLA